MASLDVTWVICFAFGIWTLWTYQNGFLFRNDRSQLDPKHEILAKPNEFAYIRINGKPTANRRIIRVTWLKLNYDGSSLGNPGRSGGGGLIRNDKGE